MKTESEPRIAFFGGEPLAVPILSALREAGMLPALVVANPDRPSGRKMEVAPPAAKVWAEVHGVSVVQPESFRDGAALGQLAAEHFDLFIIAAYGRILPERILELPERGTLGVHPSLLPKLRGPSPIRSAILEDERETGVSIMEVVREMDAGPILSQRAADIRPEEWPLPGRELDRRLATLGGELLLDTLPLWLSGQITPRAQDSDRATYCTKIEKQDGELEIDPRALPTGARAKAYLRKVRAYDDWPGTYFFTERSGTRVRIKITDAIIGKGGTFTPLTVIPEGRKEMPWEQFLAWLS